MGKLAGTVGSGDGWIVSAGLAVFRTTETDDKVTGATGALRLLSDAQAAPTAYIREEVRETGALNGRIAYCWGDCHRLLVAGNSQARQQLEDPEELLGSEHVADRGPLMDERRRREIDQVREIVDEEADIRTGIESATQSVAECAPQVESVTREEFARLELSSLEYKSTPSGIFSPDTAPPFMRLVGNLVRERKDGTVWARLSPDTGEGRGFRRLDEHTALMAQEYSPGELAAAGIECHVSLHVDTGDVPGHGPAGYPASGSVGLWAKPGVLGISLKGEGFYHLIASRHWDEAKAAKFPEFLQWAKPAPREWLSNIASEAELKTLLMALLDEKIGVLTSGRRDLAQPRPGRTGAPLLSRVRPRGAPDAAPR